MKITAMLSRSNVGFLALLSDVVTPNPRRQKTSIYLNMLFIVPIWVAIIVLV